jgi:hypothetical protein
MESTIFVSIASYLDLELEQTVLDILRKAKNPKRLFLSIYSQNRDGMHPDLESLCSLYGAGIDYIMDDFRNSKGTCFARSICQKALSPLFTYYLQIDSHTIFTEGWDDLLIKDYNMSGNKWDKFIFSTYPLCYYYRDHLIKEEGSDLGEYFLETKENQLPNCLEIVRTKHFSRYAANYIPYDGDVYGKETNYFAAGFAFGYSKYFIDNPYDIRIYHSGEEPTLSIRFFCNDIKIVCPPRNYCFHHFSGESCGRRQSHWTDDNEWEKKNHSSILNELNRVSEKVLNDFYSLTLHDGLGVINSDKYREWLLQVKEVEVK